MLLAPDLASRLPGHDVTHLKGHRFLAIGAERPRISSLAALSTHVWDEGQALGQVLDRDTVVIAAPGAAAGCGRLLGAEVITPAGATGDVSSDLWAKTRAALSALRRVRMVVVHVGGADEAAHHCDRVGKRALLEAADADVIRPLARAVGEGRGVMAVTSDHATCVETGRHHAEPVPLLIAGRGVPRAGAVRLHERLVARARIWETPFAPAEVVA
jgi:2,3-bisphosphoglycerate-independent phosphoglycerate mutase